MKRVIPLVIIAIGLVSCRYHEALMTSNANITPESQIVGLAKGEAKTSLVFGIGGLKTRTLTRDAKSEMYLYHPLKNGQAYANLNMDMSRSFYPLVALPIVIVNRAVVTADIIQLDSSKTSDELQPLFKLLLENKSQDISSAWTLDWLQVRDSVAIVADGRIDKAEVVRILDDKKTVIKTFDGSVFKMSLNKVYLYSPGTKLPGNYYEVGSQIAIPSAGEVAFGHVIAINKKKVVFGIEGKREIIKARKLQKVEEKLKRKVTFKGSAVQRSL